MIKFSIAMSIILLLVLLGQRMFRWDVVSAYGRYLPLLIIVAIVTYVLFRKIEFWNATANTPGFSTFSISLFLILMPIILVNGYFMYANFKAMEQDKLELNFPLRDGSYYIASGGASSMVNIHYPLEAQRYALDITKLSTMGARASGLMPDNLNRYYIYKNKLYSPCSGEVTAVGDGAADQLIGGRDKNNLAGNYIAIYCDGFTVLMAHMSGSPLVKKGDKISITQHVGYVGNSGNTTEPHLHIHAVAGWVNNIKELAWGSKGVPIIFDGSFLQRNDVVMK